MIFDDAGYSFRRGFTFHGLAEFLVAEFLVACEYSVLEQGVQYWLCSGRLSSYVIVLRYDWSTVAGRAAIGDMSPVQQENIELACQNVYVILLKKELLISCKQYCRSHSRFINK